jgi:hypothetical protein
MGDSLGWTDHCVDDPYIMSAANTSAARDCTDSVKGGFPIISPPQRGICERS